MILAIPWSDAFLSVGYAQEGSIYSKDNPRSKVGDAQKKNASHASHSTVCRVELKANCQSQPLLVEEVKLDEFLDLTQSSSLLVKTSFSYPQHKKNFLTPEIYVDQQHRNFRDEIIEIFDQSLLLQDWQDGAPLLLECHCDRREPQAYSLLLGHRWGKRVTTYMQNLAIHASHIELMNYGNEYDVCDTNWGECQQGSRLQATFTFLSIREPNSGCLIRLQLPTQPNHRKKVVEAHPLFLQEIHVAGVWAKQTH